MAGWAGFSENELKRIKQQRDAPHTAAPCPPEAFLSLQQSKAKKGVQAQKMTKQGKAVSVQPDPAPKATPSPVAAQESREVKKHCEERQKTENTDIQMEQPGLTIKHDDQLSRKEMELRDKSTLDQLQLEQRLIEEKNKRKKALLAKTIAERSKKTQAEAVKLKRIQKQLQALDDLVSTDISILRNRIEQACIEFSHAKKRYDRAESEYISAKLDLHKKTQIKEQLTEHLCTIIQQNEQRKAKRLEELMHELDVETDEERLELDIEVEHMLQLQEAEAKKLLQIENLSEKDSQSSKVQEKVSAVSNKDLTQPEINSEIKSVNANEIEPINTIQETKTATEQKVNN